MVAAIRQIVSIPSAGTAGVRSPTLRADIRAEAIVSKEEAKCRPLTLRRRPWMFCG